MAAADVTGDPVQALAYKLIDLHRRQVGEEFEEMWGDSSRASCGGWTYDPPCGGCYDCVEAQSMYAMPEYSWYLQVAQQAHDRLAVSPPGTEIVLCIDELNALSRSRSS